MKNDISRNTFDPTKHFSRVLMQQGRVQLDADWNEQASIFMHYLRTLATDLIGPHGGPERQCGFELIDATVATAEKIEALKGANFTDAGFFIGPGRYYVDGLLCENESYVSYAAQHDRPIDPEELKKLAGSYVAYLDVWERLITAAEDESIREVALGGPDTATRAKVVWQVKLLPLKTKGATCADGAEALKHLTRPALPQLRAQLKPEASSTDPCTLSPDSRYRGAENQLYRVEIHQVSEDGKTVTFKWSRENGSVVFPVLEANADANETVVTLAHLGRDAHLGLAEEDWVELVDDDSVLLESTGPLLQVRSIQRDEGTVTLRGSRIVDPKKHALLRRWDHRGDPQNLPGGAVKVAFPTDPDADWLDLEDGVQIQFQMPKDAAFRTGDYWLIPARTTGKIEWPEETDDKNRTTLKALPPRGVVHHYAPLGIISADRAGKVTRDKECRCQFKPVPPKADQHPELSVAPDWPE